MTDETSLRINAFWDQDSETWTAQCPDIPGFGVGAETLEELLMALRAGLPETAEACGTTITDFDKQVRITTAGFLACGC